MKTTTRMLKKLLLLSAVILTSNQMIAQTLPSSAITQSVCIGIEDYEIVPNPTSTYSWSIIDQGTGFSPLVGEADISPITGDFYIQVDFTMVGVYVLSVLEFDANSCQGAIVDLTITVNAYDDPSFTFASYCESNPGSPVITGTTGGVFTFNTSPSSGETIDPSSGLITGGLGGTAYDVLYTTNGTCSQFNTVSVSVTLMDDPSFTFASYCESNPGSPVITGTTGGVFTFNTSPSSGETIDPSSGLITGGLGGTAYDVLYTTNGTCSQFNTVSVSVTLPPNPFAGANDTICEGLDYTLSSATNSGNSGTYSWIDATGSNAGFSNPAILNPVYTPTAIDIAAGSVILELQISGITPCTMVSSYITIIINANPTPGPIYHN